MSHNSYLYFAHYNGETKQESVNNKCTRRTATASNLRIIFTYVLAKQNCYTV